MDSLTLAAKALVDPVDAVPLAVSRKTWAVPLLAATLLAVLSGAAVASRLDLGQQVVAELSARGALANASEREVQESITRAERVRLVGAVASGLFGVPLLMLACAALLKLTLWLLGQSATYHALFSAACVAQLPAAVHDLIVGLAAIRQSALADSQVPSLVPSSLAALTHAPGPLARLAGGVDFFGLWSVALLGLGLAAASGMRRGRALLVSLVLYALYVAVFLVGLPGLVPGGPPQ